MKKGSKTPAASGENGTLDIPHEEIHGPGTAVAVTPKVMSADDQIKTELVKFNFTDAAISQLKETYGGLTIKDETDKAGYEAVKKAWNDVRTKRTGLEKKGLELRNSYTVITKAIKGEEVRLIESLTPLEEDLYSKWKKIDDDKERKKKEQEEEEGRRLMARIETLQECGMSFRDGFYQIGDTITADVATLRAMPDNMFEKLKGAVITKNAEIKRERDQEAARKATENAERERQQQELKRQQEELAEQQRQLQAQKDEMAKQLREMRLGKLHALGMELEGDHVIKWETVRLYIAPLIDMTADEFSRTLDTTAEQIKELKNKKAQEEEKEKQQKAEKERREKHIAAALETAGLKYNWAAKNFTFKNDFLDLIVTWDEMLPLTDGQVAHRATKIANQLNEATVKQQKKENDDQAEKQRQEKLGLSDKQRWTREIEQMATQALRIEPGEYKTKAYNEKAQKFLDRLTNLINEFKP